MAHSAQPPTPPRRRLEIIGGSVLLILGLIATVVAIVAHRQPKGREAGVADTSSASSTLPTTSASTTGPATSATSASVGSASTANSPTTVQTTTPTTTGSTPVTPPATTPPGTTPPPANRLPLIVLNNTSTSALTTSALARFRAGGWTATDGGFFDGGIVSTAAYYDPDADGSKAAALALQSQFPSIKRVVARFGGLPAGPVVVVLTTDYS